VKADWGMGFYRLHFSIFLRNKSREKVNYRYFQAGEGLTGAYELLQ
jgi:hypothetical protein